MGLELAVYHPWTYLRGGIERFLNELIERSEHRWTLFTHHFSPEETFSGLSNARVVELAPRVDVRRSFGPLVRGAWTLARTSIPSGYGAMLVSSDGLGDFVTFRSAIPVACYCHTPLKILHDPVTALELRRRNPRQALALKVLGPAFNTVDRRAWGRYRHAFANSAETRRRIEGAGLRPNGAVEVLHPGVDLARFGLPETRRERRFLVAGRVMWQKRVEMAIEAFELARRRGMQGELVVAGALDEKSRTYLRELESRAAGLPVRFRVDCSDDEMAHLYATSLATVFTAPNEDWGIVPLESMAAGTPVIAPASGGVAESVVHGVTGWLVKWDARSYADKMLEVAGAGNEIRSVREGARRRAAEFGWGQVVGRIDEVMEALAARRPVPDRSQAAGEPGPAHSSISGPDARVAV